MANVALFRAGLLPQYLTSVHTPDYATDPDALVNPDLGAVANVALKYWKRVGSAIQEQTSGEKATTDAAIAAALVTATHAEADATVSATAAEGVELRAVVGLLVDELNVLRQFTRNLKAEIAAATSLANLQTRVGGLSTLADRTLAQAKTAYQARISSGGAD